MNWTGWTPPPQPVVTELVTRSIPFLVGDLNLDLHTPTVTVWGVAGVNWNPVAEGGFHPHGLGALSDLKRLEH